MGSVEFGQVEITLTYGLLKILLFNSYVFRWILNDNFTYKKKNFWALSSSALRSENKSFYSE